MDNSLTLVLGLLVGLAIGAVSVWSVFRLKAQHFREVAKGESAAELATLEARLAAKSDEINALQAAVQREVTERQRLASELRQEANLRSSAEEKASRVMTLESALSELRDFNASLQANQAAAESRLASQEKNAAEKIELLVNAREALTDQFKSLASEILDEKSRKFADQNKANLDTLLRPLGERIRDFEKKVEEVYVKESQQRFSLEKEIKTLSELNNRISTDAVNLTNALKGQTKTQGAWGEVILERVLEMSGLAKGREYEIQVTLTSEEGRRSCPDVIVYLPEQRHLVIDSKVNLVAYEKYCSLGDGPERDAELKKNISAFKKHIGELDLKRYQDHYKLNSLDFVLMFVPVEGAFMTAVQADPGLFNQAFEKNLVIVSPSTLLATMRTISNLWRQEYQSRNAAKIARQAGRLYDKFVSFVNDLEEIGKKLNSAQGAYEAAHNKLMSGRGNIVSRVENLQVLGARAKKKLDAEFVEEAMQNEDADELVEIEETSATYVAEVGLFPELKMSDVSDDEEESFPLLSVKSATVGES